MGDGFTGPVATVGHIRTMMAFPGQVLMEYNQGMRPVPCLHDFLDRKNGRVWPDDRPARGVSIDEKQLTFIEAMIERSLHEIELCWRGNAAARGAGVGPRWRAWDARSSTVVQADGKF